MKKRIKKKQSRLVAKWLAEHPDVVLQVRDPYIPSIRTFTVTPQRFSAKIDFRNLHRYYFNEQEWDIFVREELARQFLDVVAESICLKEESQDDITVRYVATLDIVPYASTK